jgi:hypothetical protein
MNWSTALGRVWSALIFLAVSLIASGAAQAVKPSFTSANTTTFTVGTNGTFLVAASGDTPMRIYINGKKLPRDVTLTDHGDGTATLAGIPQPGTGRTYSFKLNARNASGKTMQNFTLVVQQSPTITSPDNLTCLVGSLCTLTVTTAGNPTSTVTRSALDALPDGMTFTTNANGTGTLTGTPLLGTQGVYNFTFTAANGVLPNAVQNFTLTVNRFLNFTSADNTTCTVGTFCTFAVAATGVPVPTISHSSGALPAGMTYVAGAAGTGTLSGTPLALSGGVYHPVFTAHNGAETDATQNFVLTVNEAPSITSSVSSSCAVGLSCDFDVTTSGYPPPTVDRNNAALPGGVAYTDNGDGTGSLNGNPDPGSEGVYPMLFTASNGIGSDATQNFTLTVNASLAITSAASTTCIVGTACNFTITTVGGGTITIGLTTGMLPGGMAFADQGDGTATLSGPPSAGAGGVYNLKFTAANGSENFEQNFTLTVNEASSITSADNTTCVVGTACTFTVTTLGYPIPAISKTGALPAGITFVDNGDRTATLSGPGAVGAGGVYALTINATNGIGTAASQGFTLTENEAPTFTSPAPANGFVNGPYTHNYTAAAYPAATFSITAGGFPPGLMLTGSTLSGTPTMVGTFTGTVTATNGINPDATQNFSITIDAVAPSLLTVQIHGTGTGTVDSVPLGIACPGDCSESFSTGSAVTLTATPTGGSVFMGWLGGGCDLAPVCVVTLNAATTVQAFFAPALTSGTLDIDDSAPGTKYDGPTDGMLALRFMFGLTGTQLSDNATGITANRNSGQIAAYLADILPRLDIDGNGEVDALTDGILIVRYMFGLTGSALIEGAVGPNAQRGTAPAIETRLQLLTPP